MTKIIYEKKLNIFIFLGFFFFLNDKGGILSLKNLNLPVSVGFWLEGSLAAIEYFFPLLNVVNFWPCIQTTQSNIFSHYLTWLTFDRVFKLHSLTKIIGVFFFFFLERELKPESWCMICLSFLFFYWIIYDEI